MGRSGFSWKRATGITGAKRKIAKATGIPTTKQGRKRKAQNILWKMIFGKQEGKRMKRLLIGLAVCMMSAVPAMADVDFQTKFAEKEVAEDGTFDITKDELIESLDIQSIEWDDNWVPYKATLSNDYLISLCVRADTDEQLMIYVCPYDFDDTLSLLYMGTVTYNERKEIATVKEVDHSVENHTAKEYSYLTTDLSWKTDYTVNAGKQMIDFVLTCPAKDLDNKHNEELIKMATSIVFNKMGEDQ